MVYITFINIYDSFFFMMNMHNTVSVPTASVLKRTLEHMNLTC